MRNIFGTDGIRGVYPYEVDDSLAYLVGAELCLEEDVIVVGKDTRKSGESLASALISGIYDKGGTAVNVGVLPSAAIAYLTRSLGARYGVMITASHNPPQYNGLKIFDSYGVKLCEQKQKSISAKINNQKVYFGIQRAQEKVFIQAEDLYVDYLLDCAKVDLSGICVMLDCCFGAAYRVAPKVFKKANAKVSSFNNSPCGNKINVHCGAVYPWFLKSAYKENVDLAFSFDGDADRLRVIEQGVLLEEERIFYAYGKYMANGGKLTRSAVIGTVLTNGGTQKAFNNLGISLLRSQVGDVKIYELMRARKVNLGGETSGHYLFSNYSACSDALLNALLICRIYKEVGSIKEYTEELQLEYFVNCDIALPKEKTIELQENGTLERITRDCNSKFPQIRIVLRPSGTEPKLRVYAEGKEEKCRETIEYARSQIELLYT